LVGHPDRRVGRRAARPGDAHAFLSGGGIQQRQKDNRSNGHLQQLHTTLLTLDERMREYSVGAILLSIRFAAGIIPLARKRDRDYDRDIVHAGRLAPWVSAK
jgi:hypothetical protein